MEARNWLLRTISTILVAVGVVVGSSYAIDPFGVWHDPSGRKLAVYSDYEKAKFLMNERYVPANFNGLLVGSSVTANWNLSNFGEFRIYNESLNGANGADEETLVHQALSHQQHYKLAIVVLTPFMTRTHDIKEGMDSTKVTEALGSFAVLENEVGRALASAHVKFRGSDLASDGQVSVHEPKNLKPELYGPSYYEIDPIALKDYQSAVRSLQNNGARVVYIVPPMYEACYETNKQGLDAYTVKIRTLLPPAPLIDFSDAKYTALRSDPKNFIDCVHFEPQGAEKFVAILPGLVKQLLPAS